MREIDVQSTNSGLGFGKLDSGAQIFIQSTRGNTSQSGIHCRDWVFCTKTGKELHIPTVHPTDNTECTVPFAGTLHVLMHALEWRTAMPGLTPGTVDSSNLKK